MNILGISAFYHDSAAALVRDGEIIAAAQEERFSRKRHDADYPSNAIAYCLEESGISASEVDYVAFYDKPWLKAERLLETYLSVAPRGFESFASAFHAMREKSSIKKTLASEFPASQILFAEHHQSHASSAFYPSPFEEALVLTMDGAGEWATTSAAVGRGNKLDIFKEIHFPHSLGLLYSAFTYYAGFKVNSGEYKLMGLAPYGRPVYVNTILDRLIDVKLDGSFRLNMEYFDYCAGLTMTNDKFAGLFGGAVRRAEDPIEQRHKDVAASAQAALEICVLCMVRGLVKETGLANLCLAGGVALNCVANGAILRDGCVRNLWIQPAAGDAGGALGAALSAYYQHVDSPRVCAGEAMKGALLGPSYSQAEIERRLLSMGARYRTVGESELLRTCAEAIAEQKAVGWFQGRMEFGPRALGARSILADPRSAEMQSVLNLKVKKRESFRPFAPSVTVEDSARYFDMKTESPYMLLTAQALGDELPATTHVDKSARVQTVDPERNPRYHALLKTFETITGCPVLVNTSFNVRGEPIVCTPEDAFRCFLQTDIEMLAIGDSLLRKEDQDMSLAERCRQDFEPD